ncbi:EFR1 family ferrodoxin [Gabonibacter massiliensis]|uniref:EFR1 family ferrodoxin n=1 Tax=Gabonibacter massiliensis TaxID=1720195 RepID=UPI0025709D45|nr:EFR1 family ferrodoxin [Gabonibacter massiliensis]
MAKELGKESGMIDRVVAVYFSPTGTTRRSVSVIAAEMARILKVTVESYDFTLPSARSTVLAFKRTDMVVLGTPVYAGRVPNVLLKYLATLQGNEAIGIPVVLFGNRDYDDALIELRDIMERAGFHVTAAAAFIGEHSFSQMLAKGRPDERDAEALNAFAARVAEKYKESDDRKITVKVKGTPYPYRGYYTPRDRKGNAVDIRKVMPVTNDRCIDCKLCVEICPMGSISYDDVREYTGICIKCGACIKRCPMGAKYYEDAGYLYHKQELEEGLTERREPELFL